MAVSPYTTAVALGRPAPTYVPNPQDNERVRSYSTYEDIFNNVPEAFRSLLRDEDDEKSRRYIPVARTLIEATNSYLAKGLTWSTTIPPDVTIDQESIDLMMNWLDAFFAREEFPAKFLSMKRWMLVKGDGVLQVSADQTKEEGKRIRITEIPPDSYFVIEDQLDPERVTGVYLVTLTSSPDGQTTVAQREEYHRILTEEDSVNFGGPIGTIFYRMSFYEIDKWDDRAPFNEESLSPVDYPVWLPPLLDDQALILQGVILDPNITAIPVYHFRNRRRGTAGFGMSELQGLETPLAGVIQNATDEDMAVALTGLGVYWTDSGSPKNADGTDAEWAISPASVLEMDQGSKFGRVDGITSVTPMQDHISFLTEAMQETSGTPAVAVGDADVAVAESGIALAIRMAPLVSKNGETEVELKSKLTQMMYDLLSGWIPAYEGIQYNGVLVKPHFEDPMPVDRAATIAEVTTLVAAKIVDAEYARQYLADKLGFSFPDDLGTRMAAAAQVELDAVGARMDAALTGGAPAVEGGAV